MIENSKLFITDIPFSHFDYYDSQYTHRVIIIFIFLCAAQVEILHIKHTISE